MAKTGKTIGVQLTTWEFVALEKALEVAISNAVINSYSGRELHDKLNLTWSKVYPGR